MADNSAQHGRPSGTPGADAIDPNALSKALLKEFEDAGRARDITPGGSPSRKRQRVYCDR
jgi:cell division cycle 20-like protein 1 (cofactor of APC complex)